MMSELQGMAKRNTAGFFKCLPRPLTFAYMFPAFYPRMSALFVGDHILLLYFPNKPIHPSLFFILRGVGVVIKLTYICIHYPTINNVF
jgi:hypothetical protein